MLLFIGSIIMLYINNKGYSIIIILLAIMILYLHFFGFVWFLFVSVFICLVHLKFESWCMGCIRAI